LAIVVRARLRRRTRSRSFRRAMELGADGVEFDVVPSRDGIPIVIHDDTLERTTNGVGIVWNYDYAELEKFDATKLIAGFKAESIPTLQNTLEMLPMTHSSILNLKTMVI
jgi:glycerophosphoryl diester phosphodiesterase